MRFSFSKRFEAGKTDLPAKIENNLNFAVGVRILIVNTSSAKIFISKVYREAYRKISSIFDFLLLKLDMPYPPARRSSLNQKLKIVYVVDGMMPRASRISKWVKRSTNFSTILIANKIGFLENFSNDEWDGVFLFRNQYHLKRILGQVKGVYLYHGFAPKSFYPDLVRQFVKRPFLIDYQDVFTCYYGLDPKTRWIKRELPFEKNCLLLSQGIVAHSLEPNIAVRKYAEKKPPALFFPVYCDDDTFLDNDKQLDAGEIHFVYAGGIAGSHRDKTHYGSIQFHDLIRVLENQQIHFHIYPSPTNVGADCEEYEQIAQTSNYFHFHPAVSQEAIASEVNRYHFGILPFFSTHSNQSKDKYKYATSMKLFNYIEAGIPVLCSEDLVYQSWIVRRYDAGVVIGKDDMLKIRQIVMAQDYRAVTGNLMARRKEISLSRHIPRLIKFYQEVTQRWDAKS